MSNYISFTASQIRYMIWLSRLSRGGFGVKNTELATVLGFSKPSVHNMLKSLAELGIVTQKSFGLAHFTEWGASLSKRYEVCFAVVEGKIGELCEDDFASESAVCAILADIPPEKIDELCEAHIRRES